MLYGPKLLLILGHVQNTQMQAVGSMQNFLMLQLTVQEVTARL